MCEIFAIRPVIELSLYIGSKGLHSCLDRIGFARSSIRESSRFWIPSIKGFSAVGSFIFGVHISIERRVVKKEHTSSKILLQRGIDLLTLQEGIVLRVTIA